MKSIEEIDEYEIKIKTGISRGSSLSDPLAGVFLCIIGSDERAVLHYISPTIPISLPLAVVDGKSRFLQGAVDKICVRNPKIGSLEGLLVGPERGSWNLDEIEIFSKSTDEEWKFICRKMLGTKNDSAAFLAPLPPDTVLYGSGPTASFLTLEEAGELQRIHLEKYRQLKTRILTINAGLVLAGSLFEAAVWGLPFASLFIIGGIGGLIYEYLLQESIDSLASEQSEQQTNTFQTRFKSFLSSPLSRVLLAIILLSTAYMLPDYLNQNQEVSPLPATHKAQQLLNFTSSFLFYKVATVSSAVLSPNDDHTTIR